MYWALVVVAAVLLAVGMVSAARQGVFPGVRKAEIRHVLTRNGKPMTLSALAAAMDMPPLELAQLLIKREKMGDVESFEDENGARVWTIRIPR